MMTNSYDRLIGMDMYDAMQAAKAFGLSVVLWDGGAPQQLVNDYRSNRITLRIEEGKVVGYKMG